MLKYTEVIKVIVIKVIVIKVMVIRVKILNVIVINSWYGYFVRNKIIIIIGAGAAINIERINFTDENHSLSGRQVTTYPSSAEIGGATNP